MRYAVPTMWSFCLLMLLGTSGTSRAQDLRPDASQLTVDRLFGASEFDAEAIPEMRWSKRSSTYTTLDKSPTGKGVDLVRHDPATEKKEVYVPASAFIPKNAKEPLNIEGFEFSADESRLLIYTNSKKVWRRNTRGD